MNDRTGQFAHVRDEEQRARGDGNGRRVDDCAPAEHERGAGDRAHRGSGPRAVPRASASRTVRRAGTRRIGIGAEQRVEIVE